MKKFLIYAGVATVFVDTKFLFPPRSFSFDFYDYYIIFVAIIGYYILTYRDLKILPKWYIWGLVLLLAGTVIAAYPKNLLGFPLIKALIGLFFSSTAYYLVFKMAEFNVTKLFRIYLDFALVAAVFGIIQELLALAGVYVFFGPIVRGGFFYRISSFSGEPYFFGTVLLPALIYYSYLLIGPSSSRILRTRDTNLRASVIFAGFLLTFSAAGFFVFFVGVIIITLYRAIVDKIGYSLLYIPLALLLINLSSDFLNQYDKNYNKKVEDSFTLFGGPPNKRTLLKMNSSSFSLASNYLILQKSFSENPMFGIGLGNYQYNYNLYFDQIVGKGFRKKYLDQNAKDGNSMFIRLVTETGLWGLLLFLFFVIRYCIAFRNASNPVMMLMEIIQLAIITLFLLRLLRTGNYFGQGFFFFFFLYYYAWMTFRQVKTSAPTLTSKKN